jgi:hypothetical protein
VDVLQHFVSYVLRASAAEAAGLGLLALLVTWALGAGIGVTGAGLVRRARKGASALAAWWREPSRLARIETRLGEVYGLVRPPACPVDWCCAACGRHRPASGAECRCGCAAVVPAGAYGTKGNHVGGDHAC